MITGPLCRAARALTEISRDQLAQASGVAAPSVMAFEHKVASLSDKEIALLQRSLEQFGAVFIAANGGGVGVRLKYNEGDAKRIARLEGEGGIVASDDVP